VNVEHMNSKQMLERHRPYRQCRKPSMSLDVNIWRNQNDRYILGSQYSKGGEFD